MQNNREYDVVFSFAGAQRDYVKNVKDELTKYGVSVFYDDDNSVDLWGKNLFTFLAELYSQKAVYCVMFISKEYKERAWTIHESQFAMERVFNNYGEQDTQEYLLPVIFDDTTISGLSKTIAYMDARKESPKKLAEYIAKKVGKFEADCSMDHSVNFLFKHMKSVLSDYAKRKSSLQIYEKYSTINVCSVDCSRNVIAIQLIEKYIYLYLGDFTLGLNPAVIVFEDKV